MRKDNDQHRQREDQPDRMISETPVEILESTDQNSQRQWPAVARPPPTNGPTAVPSEQAALMNPWYFPRSFNETTSET